MGWKHPLYSPPRDRDSMDLKAAERSAREEQLPDIEPVDDDGPPDPREPDPKMLDEIEAIFDRHTHGAGDESIENLRRTGWD